MEKQEQVRGTKHARDQGVTRRLGSVEGHRVMKTEKQVGWRDDGGKDHSSGQN